MVKKTIPFLDYQLTRLTLKEILEDYIPQTLKTAQFNLITTLNPQLIMNAEQHPEIKSMIQKSLCIADGDGIALFAKGIEKIAGVDLVKHLLESKHLSIYAIGGTPEVLEKTNVSYTQHGFFEEEEIPRIITDIHEKKPDIILVAMGVPKQEQFLLRLLPHISHGIGIGVGGSLDVLTGSKKRAPQWCIRLHMEWLYRGLSEPTRMKKWGYMFSYLVKLATFRYNSPS